LATERPASEAADVTTVEHRVELGTRTSRALGVVSALLIGVLVLLPFVVERSFLVSLTELMILIALGQLWNLLAGYSGIFSFGQQAYVGIGAYATFALADLVGLNIWLAIALSGVVALVIAYSTAFLIFRLEGGYFAVATWVVAETFRLLVKNNDRLNPGGTPQPLRTLASLGPDRFQIIYWLAVAVGLGSVILTLVFLRSRWGLALSAIRDDEETAAASGIDVHRVKMRVYLLVAAMTGLTGSVYLLNNVSIDPDSYFSIGLTAQMVVVVVVGGLGTVEGPIVGALIYFLLDENLSVLGTWWFITLGVLLIVLLLVAPRGVWGTIQARTGLRLFPTQRRLIVGENRSVHDGPTDDIRSEAEWTRE
jgi:branched-chain amino acid transport system permease protein